MFKKKSFDNISEIFLNILDLYSTKNYLTNIWSYCQQANFVHNFVVDIGTNGFEDAYAYIPDPKSYYLIVYDYKNNRNYRAKYPYSE